MSLHAGLTKLRRKEKVDTNLDPDPERVFSMSKV